MESLSMLKNDLTNIINTLTSKGYKLNNVFDIGANAGKWTLKYEKVLNKSQFFLFEANPNHSRPKKLNKKHKWFNCVLSSPDIKEVKFYSLSGTGDSYYKERTHAYKNCTPLQLKTITLDDAINTYVLPKPQLIKLDTQGSELDILEGAKNIIKYVDIILIEMPILPYNKGAPLFNDYMNYLTSLDYIPVGPEEFHFADNMFVQLDIAFLKKNVKTKYYGNKNLFME